MRAAVVFSTWDELCHYVVLASLVSPNNGTRTASSVPFKGQAAIVEPATTKQRNVEYKNSQAQASSQPWWWVGSGISIAIESPQTTESAAETSSRTQPCQHLKYPVSMSCFSNSHIAILDVTLTKFPKTGLKESAKIFTLGQK